MPRKNRYVDYKDLTPQRENQDDRAYNSVPHIPDLSHQLPSNRAPPLSPMSPMYGNQSPQGFGPFYTRQQQQPPQYPSQYPPQYPPQYHPQYTPQKPRELQINQPVIQNQIPSIQKYIKTQDRIQGANILQAGFQNDRSRIQPGLNPISQLGPLYYYSMIPQVKFYFMIAIFILLVIIIVIMLLRK